MSAVEPGTVISGTMRDEDVIPALLAVLDVHDPDKAGEIRAGYPITLATLTGGDEQPDDFEFVLGMLREDLWDAMQEIAPDGFYFGAHEGDGADYGFWPSEDD